MHEEEDVLGMWGPDYHKIAGSTAFFSVRCSRQQKGNLV